MAKHEETIKEAVEKYLKYNPCNPCYQDSWYIESIYTKYGYDAVSQEIKRQEKEDNEVV
jgi:hypothetical protein